MDPVLDPGQSATCSSSVVGLSYEKVWERPLKGRRDASQAPQKVVGRLLGPLFGSRVLVGGGTRGPCRTLERRPRD